MSEFLWGVQVGIVIGLVAASNAAALTIQAGLGIALGALAGKEAAGE